MQTEKEKLKEQLAKLEKIEFNMGSYTRSIDEKDEITKEEFEREWNNLIKKCQSFKVHK